MALRRLVANLIDTALRYGTHARVTVERSASQVTVLVDDDGPGIPGLGLAIARAITEAHGGHISAEAGPAGERASAWRCRRASVAPAPWTMARRASMMRAALNVGEGARDH